MPTVVNKIVESFPHPIVTLIIGILIYNTLVGSIYQMLYNAASMQTTLGNDNLGFLALTVFPMVYATLFTTPFEKLPHPGPAPNIPSNATIIKHIAIQYKFALYTELYLLHTNMYKALT